MACAQARLDKSQGNLEAALLQLDEARRTFVKTPIPDVHPPEAMKAVVYLKQGRLSVAQEWLRVRKLSVDDEISYLREFEHLTLARILIAESQSPQGTHSMSQAIGLLERLLQKAEDPKSVVEVSLKSL